MDDVQMVSSGAKHALIVKKDKTLWATGDNTYGQLGNGTTIGVKYLNKL
jgi:alpha-tubulin suppressor-like RCC1 family protein